MDASSYMDINKICRVCLKNDVLVSVFSTAFTIRPVDMIRKLDLFKVDTSEGLSVSLCQSCTCRLVDAYNFKQQSEISDLRLREYMNAALPVSFVMKSNCIQEDLHCSSSEQAIQKEDEIYDAMNAVCDIFDRNNSNDVEVADDVLNDVVIDVNSLSRSENGDTNEEIVNELQNEDFSSHDDESEDQGLKEKKATKENKTKKLRGSKNTLKAPEKCEQCGKTFSYVGYLEIHLRTHTGEKPFQCDVCDKRFSQSSNLSLHMRIHTGERRYQCEICSKLFTTSSNLTAHRKTHSEERNFKCTECPRSFKTQAELVNHSGTHSGVKNHICKICEKSFYKVSYLNMHLRTVHKGEKRYKCSECSKLFSSSSNLTCHYRIHTGEKPFKCKSCSARFNQSSSLVRHSKQHKISKSNTLEKESDEKFTRNKEKNFCSEYILIENAKNDNEALTNVQPNILDFAKSSELGYTYNHPSLQRYDISRLAALDYSRHHQSFEFHQFK